MEIRIVRLRVLQRSVLLVLAMAGCFAGFIGLMFSVGAVLQQKGIGAVFPISESLEFPLPVVGTDLIARQLIMYEGPFLENGSDTPVSDIMALLLYNDGQQEIAQAEVTVTAGEKLTFFASNIMPGAQVLVLEANAHPWQDAPVTSCTGTVNLQRNNPLPEQALQIETVDMGTLLVTNTTKADLRDVWLFYKNYVPEGEVYVGGITYIQPIDYLPSGQTLRLEPSHFAAGYSRILKAELIE